MARKIQISDALAIRKLTPTQGAKAYAELRESVTRAGLLNRDYSYYTLLTLFTISGIGVSLYQFAVHTNIFLLIVWSTAIAFFTVQLGGLVHDAGHRAIFHSSRSNDIAGLIYSSIVGFAYTKWRMLHNSHHAHTNQEDSDPDLEVPFVFTKERYQENQGWRAFIQRYQVWLYYPLGSLTAFFQRFGSLSYYVKNFQPGLTFEIVIFIVSICFWYGVPFLLFPLWKALLFFVLVNIETGFYLLNVFAPNHKGMPQIARDVKFSFLEQQVITARNIYGHWMTDYLYLGLNYQIEHHLFPNCPRRNLKLISPYVRKICRKYHLPFTETSIIGSNQFILSELKQISAAK